MPLYFLRAVTFLRVVRFFVVRLAAGLRAALVRLRARFRAFFAPAFLAVRLRAVFLTAFFAPAFLAVRFLAGLRAFLAPAFLAVRFFAALRALFLAGNLVTSFPRD